MRSSRNALHGSSPSPPTPRIRRAFARRWPQWPSLSGCPPAPCGPSCLKRPKRSWAFSAAREAGPGWKSSPGDPAWLEPASPNPWCSFPAPRPHRRHPEQPDPGCRCSVPGTVPRSDEMKTLPLDPTANQNPAALRGFLAQCRLAAAAAGRPQLVSISLAVDPLDPLAVLESIFEAKERHFYVERPAEATAVAGAAAVLAFAPDGPGRFAACRQFVDDTLEHTVAVGDLSLPFSGPLFFSAFGFLDRVEPRGALPAGAGVPPPPPGRPP